MATASAQQNRTGDDAYRLAREIEAATVLRDRYKEALGEDAELISDTIEGETDLFEKIEAMLVSIAEDDALVEAQKALEKKLKSRRDRIEKRIDTKRALILTAMQIAEIRTKQFPIATVSRTKQGDKLIIVEEADIPSSYFVPPDPPKPALDRKKLLDALKTRKTMLDELAKLDVTEREAAKKRIDETYPAIAGAELGNGGETLTVSRS